MGRYTSSFCGLYSLETGMRVIAWFYIVIYLFNIFLNIFALDIVESYKETVDEEIEYDKTSLLAFHYIFLAFGILTVVLAITTLVKLSNQSAVFMEFIFQWNIFRCVVTLIGILYACIAMNHILTVTISCVVLVIDLCCSSYFTGIIASFVKSLDNPDVLNIKESNNVKHTDICLMSHQKTSDLGQASSVRVVVDSQPQVTTETNRGDQNAGLNPETKQEVKIGTAAHGIPMEPAAKVPHVKTAGEVSQPNEEKATNNDTESISATVHAEHGKGNTESEKPDGDLGVVISENDSTKTKEQEITVDTAIKPTIEPPQNNDPAVQDTPDTGVKNLAFDAVELNQIDHHPSNLEPTVAIPRSDEAGLGSQSTNVGVNNPAFEVVELNQICTESITINVKGGDDAGGDGKMMGAEKEVGEKPAAESSEVEEKEAGIP